MGCWVCTVQRRVLGVYFQTKKKTPQKGREVPLRVRDDLLSVRNPRRTLETLTATPQTLIDFEFKVNH